MCTRTQKCRPVPTVVIGEGHWPQSGCPVLALKRPGSHSVQFCAPVGENRPRGHRYSWSEPVTLTNVPALAKRHELCPSKSWYDPRGHNLRTTNGFDIEDWLGVRCEVRALRATRPRSDRACETGLLRRCTDGGHDASGISENAARHLRPRRVFADGTVYAVDASRSRRERPRPARRLDGRSWVVNNRAGRRQQTRSEPGTWCVSAVLAVVACRRTLTG